MSKPELFIDSSKPQTISNCYLTLHLTPNKFEKLFFIFKSDPHLMEW